MHPRNPHSDRYDFDDLCHACPPLDQYLKSNPRGDRTIDFADPAAVLCLNGALLAHCYGVKHWAIPKGYLCPPIPTRADYIHHLADVIEATRFGERPVRILDIGTGANCIYPIIGSQAYGWKFVGSDIDPVSVKTARAIVEANQCLQKQIRIVHQKDPHAIFKGLLHPSDRFEATMCNPPFHDSPEAARAESQRKVRNLNMGRTSKTEVPLNFGGQPAELWCPGGEVAFILQMIRESAGVAENVKWFTSLVSKSKSLPPLQKALHAIDATQVKVIPLQQGQKKSRVIAWRF